MEVASNSHYCSLCVPLQLTVDGSRVVSFLPEGSQLRVTTVTLGAQDPLLSSGQLSGCLQGLVFNSLRINLATPQQPYSITANGTTLECGDGDPCNTQAQCPEHSSCVRGWETRSCQCDSKFKPDGVQCVNICSPNYCMNGATCSVVTAPSRPQCNCNPQYSGERCELHGTCPQGLHGPSCLSRCVCDPHGVQERVCDETGTCHCRVGSVSCHGCIQ